MNIFIGCSSKDDIEKNYLTSTEEVCSYLAKENNLVFGAYEHGMMGKAYQEFHKQEKEITSITVSDYEDSLKNIISKKSIVEKTTFDRTKQLFQHSDILLFLPGGIGTFAELYSCIEEKRTKHLQIPIIIYNESNFFDSFLALQHQLLEQKFITKEDLQYQVVSNLEELKQLLEKRK